MNYKLTSPETNMITFPCVCARVCIHIWYVYQGMNVSDCEGVRVHNTGHSY